MERIRHAIFDLDGTLRTHKDGVPNSIKEGMNHLWENGVTTTLLTARGNMRLRKVLGSDFNKVISANTNIGLENGSRIVNFDGTSNVSYFPLRQSEVDTALDVVNKGGVQFVAMFPENPQGKALMWTPNSEDYSALNEKYGDFATVVSMSIPLLNRRIQNEKPSILVVKPNNVEEVRSSFPKDFNVTGNEDELHINTQGVNKGSGVVELARLSGLHLNEVLVGGNDENDIPMFGLPVAARIQVGDFLSKHIAKSSLTVQVDTPSDLGTFLAGINFS